MCSVGDMEECFSVTFPQWPGLPRGSGVLWECRGAGPARGNRDTNDHPWSPGELVVRKDQEGFRSRRVSRQLKFGTLTGTGNGHGLRLVQELEEWL